MTMHLKGTIGAAAGSYPARRRRRGGSTRLSREDGYVILATALLLIPLMGVTALAVDYGSWLARAVQIQRAADAAALAGVVWYQDAALANSVALEAAARNGFTNGGRITVTEAPVPGMSQITVTITDSNVPNFFGTIYTKTQTITRSATAQYTPPIPMGSPYNTLGNGPDSTEPNAQQPFFFLQTFGPAGNPHNGNNYAAENCSNTDDYVCNPPNSAGANSYFDKQGYRFSVHTGATITGDLHIELYDIAQVNTGASCANGLTAAQVSTRVSTNPSIADAVRYQENAAYNPSGTNGAPYCAADVGGDGAHAITTVIVRAPDNTQLDDLDNPVITSSTCRPTQYAAFPTDNANGNDLASALGTAPSAGPTTKSMNLTSGGTTQSLTVNQFDDSSTIASGANSLLLRTTWNRWYTQCSIPSGQVLANSNYIVQVKTTVPMLASDLNPPDCPSNCSADNVNRIMESDSTATMQNHFSIRAGMGGTVYNGPTGYNNTFSFNSSTSVYANGRLPMYVGKEGGSVTTTFQLARIPTANRGRTLRTTFYDIGDNNGSAPGGNLEIRPAAEYYTSAGTYGPAGSNPFGKTGGTSSCRLTKLLGYASLNPTLSNYNGNPCTIQGVYGTNGTAGWDGSLVQVDAPIPSNYACNDAAGIGCWAQVVFNWPTGGNPEDHTVWTAGVVGDPVQLVS